MVGDMIRSVVLWWRHVTRQKNEESVGRKVLITLSDDDVVLGRLCSIKQHSLLVDQASVSNEGKMSALPHPSTVLIPMRRVVMVQYLEEASQIEISVFRKGDE